MKLRRRTKLLLVVVAGLFVLTASCAVSTITPPRAPRDPVTVYFVRETLHKGVVLPDGPGGWVEDGYGDYNWYARACDAWYHAFDTVLWPTQGTLGRRHVRAADAAALRGAYRHADLHPIRVERDKAEALHAALKARFAASGEPPLYSARYGMHFAKDPSSFWFLHTCSDAAADWLRALGCKVTWAVIRVGLSMSE